MPSPEPSTIYWLNPKLLSQYLWLKKQRMNAHLDKWPRQKGFLLHIPVNQCGNQFYSLKKCITIIMIGRKKHWTKKIGQVHGDKKLHQIISHFQRFFFELNNERNVKLKIQTKLQVGCCCVFLCNYWLHEFWNWALIISSSGGLDYVNFVSLYII